MSPTLPPRPLRVQSDARLVELARRGEAPAFEALVRRYRRPLLGYCRRLRMGDVQAEDALQQGLLQAWRALRRGDDVSDVKSWLYRIVHNAALDALRRPGADNVALDESLHCPTALSAGGELERRLAVHDALSGLAALPEMQREALVRTAVHGDSHEQVASALGLSHAAVRGLVHRARVAMRTAVTALVPSRAIQWALRSGLAAPTGGPELAVAGGGSGGMLAALAKGTAVLVGTGGILATGLAVTHDERSHHAHAAADRQPGVERTSAAVHSAPADATRMFATRSTRPGGALAHAHRNGAGVAPGFGHSDRRVRPISVTTRQVSNGAGRPASRPAFAVQYAPRSAATPEHSDGAGRPRGSSAPGLLSSPRGGGDCESGRDSHRQNTDLAGESQGASSGSHSHGAGAGGSEGARQSDGNAGRADADGSDASSGGAGSGGSGAEGSGSGSAGTESSGAGGSGMRATESSDGGGGDQHHAADSHGTSDGSDGQSGSGAQGDSSGTVVPPPGSSTDGAVDGGSSEDS